MPCAGYSTYKELRSVMTRPERDAIPDEQGGATKVRVTVRSKAGNVGTKAMYVLFVPVFDREVVVERKLFKLYTPVTVPVSSGEVGTHSGGEVVTACSGSGNSGGGSSANVAHPQQFTHCGKMSVSEQPTISNPAIIADDDVEGWKTYVDVATGKKYWAQYGLPTEGGVQTFTKVSVWVKPIAQPPPSPPAVAPVDVHVTPSIASLGYPPQADAKLANETPEGEGEQVPVDFEVGAKIVKKTKKGAQGQKANVYT
jgi:hypothetical protein